jgi:D-3-phosphoglycerate dehydrogenase
MKIAVIHDYGDAFRKTAAAARLQGHEVLVDTGARTDMERLSDIEALVLTQQRVRVTREFLARLPKLRFISQTGRNLYHLDLAACAERGIVVSAGAPAGSSPDSRTAELTWGLIIAALRHLPYEVARLKAGHWQSTVGMGLAGRTLGIYAFGHIGAAVARVGRAFGMNVVCWGREGSTARARSEGFAVAPAREAFFEGADVLSLHLPANEQTRGIVTPADLARMKPTALLVNTSRAGLIAPGALVDALKVGRPGMAAVDVFDSEPLRDVNDPLLTLPNVVATPHIGYVSRDEYEIQFTDIFDQIVAHADGAPINVVNPGVIARARQK